MNRVHIMLVDRNKNFKEVFKHIISRDEDFDVIGEAKNEIEAIELLNKIVPDIVFLDIQRYNINQIETTKRMLRHYQDIRFIIATGYKDKAYMLKMLTAGFKDSC